MFDVFYNESLRKTVVAFGSLFDEIFVQRRDKSGNTVKKVLVPITYSPKEKFKRMLDEYPLLKGDDTNVAISEVLPRMGFNLTSINYDPSRKRNTLSQRYAATDTTGVFNKQFAEVPYTLNFSLSIVTRTMDDALQIVEQILAYFTPDFTVTLNYTDINTKVDLPIVIQSITPEVDYEGDTNTQRTITFNMDFAALSYIFSPIKTQKHITKTDITNFFAFFEDNGCVTGPTGAASRIITSVTGPSGADTLPPLAGITQEIFVYPNTLSITGGTQDAQ
jgi:hypothetical protein